MRPLAVITGASGLLGGNLAALLLERGLRVRATKRPSTKVVHLAPYDIEWVPGELDDERALAEAFAGADVVFHCAALVSILKTATPEIVAANVQGTRNVVAAVRAAKCGRLVHVSTTAAVGVSRDGRPSTEDATWNFDEFGLADGYSITKRDAERVVKAAADEGLDAVIVNPGYMFGPLDEKPSSGSLIVDLVKGKVPGLVPGKNSFCDARDVAAGMIAAFEKGARGERYILAGENLRYDDLMGRVARIAGVPAPRRRIPFFAAMGLGLVGDLRAALGSMPVVTSTTVRYGFSDRFVFSSERARRELGYENRPVDDSIRDAIAWFRETGKLPRA
ncbi:MAG: NAD-dependent epimerase/dehydratase family protein [Myxococcales bacterium]|nr:NAD-dependent epimerase/dehydratase family protein [Myxococcales bacterium]